MDEVRDRAVPVQESAHEISQELLRDIDRPEGQALPLMKADGLEPPVQGDVAELHSKDVVPLSGLAGLVTDAAAQTLEEHFGQLAVAGREHEVSVVIDEASVSSHEPDHVRHARRPREVSFTPFDHTAIGAGR